MSSTEIWTYVSYGLATLLFLLAMGFIAMMVISSQNAKNNPIALPKAQKQVEQEEEVFTEEEKKGSLAGGLPTGRRSVRKAPPLVQKTPGSLKTSSIFENDDEGFRIAGGKD